MARDAITLSGKALHRGCAAAVTLVRTQGPVVWSQRGADARQVELRAVRTDWGLCVEGPSGFLLDSVEHLLAALGGLGIHSGIRVETNDDELPLLDGGARQYVEALRMLGDCASLGPSQSPVRALCVTRSAKLTHGASTYRFSPGRSVRVAVDVTFPPPIGREHASWTGDPEDFATRIAPARTFGWLDEHDALLARGRAQGADYESVLVFCPSGPHPACRPAEPEEVARHKLLDLVGDMTLHGGPPVGSVDAVAPGHGATFAVMHEAIRSGVLAFE